MLLNTSISNIVGFYILYFGCFSHVFKLFQFLYFDCIVSLNRKILSKWIHALTTKMSRIFLIFFKKKFEHRFLLTPPLEFISRPLCKDVRVFVFYTNVLVSVLHFMIYVTHIHVKISWHTFINALCGWMILFILKMTCLWNSYVYMCILSNKKSLNWQTDFTGKI